MSHFDAEAWSDYVRGAMPESEQARMRGHLEEGCAACSEHVAAFSAVVRMVDNERALDLAPGRVRAVKALFRQRRISAADGSGASRLQLVYDSLLSPAPAGVRNGFAPGRQLIFMSESLSLDLLLQPVADGTGARILGEIVARESGHLVGLPVALVAGEEVLVAGRTGEHGEFDLAGGDGETLTLRFELDERLEIEIPPLD